MTGEVGFELGADARLESGFQRGVVLCMAAQEAQARARQMKEQALRMRQQAQETRRWAEQVRKQTRQMRQRDQQMQPADRAPIPSAVLADFDLCAPPLQACAHGLGLDGLSILLACGASSLDPEAVHCWGPAARPLEDLQRVQGQGPGRDAVRTARRVLVPDVADLTTSRWPGLPACIEALGVRAVFAFPLLVEELTIGALIGHRKTPGPMEPGQLHHALGLADAIALAAADSADWLFALENLPFAHLHQATGTLTERLDITSELALLRLRAHAFGHSRTLLGTALAVLQGRISPEEINSR
ncbi:GAF domain-containing protein [Streptomyces rimosus]|uniref:GAF domain-containing protein n=1 Tax=Streptomyces rimosus TaxID=1927 RepID=UPI00067DA9D3|nr:GAF domain-containing protein [Streptomyces rimosus]